MLNRLSSSTWQHITDPQSCSLYGFNVAFDRKKMDLLREFFEGDRQDDFFPLNLRRSLQRILRFRFICLKSKVLSFFSIMTCVIIFNYLGFLHFAYRYIVRLLYVQMTNDFQNSSWQALLSCDKFREGYENHITYQTL